MASKTEKPPASSATSAGTPQLPDDYPELVARIKSEIGAARTRAALAVNEELIQLYWRIGSEILARQQREGWGSKVIERLSTDLRTAFPEMKGLSRSNIHYMRQFAAAWPGREVVPQTVGQLPWGHIRCLLGSLDSSEVREWYARQAVEHGWSRKLLEHHIATRLHERHGGAITNFAQTLPAAESELAQQILHEDYNLEFLNLAEDARERGLERSLVGQINFYVNIVDDTLRAEHHDPTIGLVLCASRNRTVARYALQGVRGPIGIARYNTTPALLEHVPEEMRDRLPHTAQISAGVQQIVDRHHGEIDDVDT